MGHPIHDRDLIFSVWHDYSKSRALMKSEIKTKQNVDNIKKVGSLITLPQTQLNIIKLLIKTCKRDFRNYLNV